MAAMAVGGGGGPAAPVQVLRAGSLRTLEEMTVHVTVRAIPASRKFAAVYGDFCEEAEECIQRPQ